MQVPISRLRSLQRTWWPHTFQMSLCVCRDGNGPVHGSSHSFILDRTSGASGDAAGILWSKARCLHLGVLSRPACGSGGNAHLHIQCICCRPVPGLLPSVDEGIRCVAAALQDVDCCWPGCWVEWAARRRL